ncbi:hypothetical protein [Paraglaciecola sp.]|uniref:hypothetical protein n=1 Tax=Paraglaciecola sp. TaxID=1920173 RepID=UPI0030F42FC8
MPLQQSDLTSLNQLGEQLKFALIEIIHQFPKQAQTIAGLSEYLIYNRSNAQRIINAINKSQRGTDVLCQLPGIVSLTEFCQKSALHGAKNQLNELQNLIETFQQNIKLHARSHTELKRMLSTNVTLTHKASVSADNNKREVLYQAVKDLIGASVDTLFCSYILSDTKKNKNYLQEIAMISKLGVVREDFAPPFVQFYTHPHPHDFVKPNKITANSTLTNKGFSIGVVEEYSTAGLLAAYSSYSPSNSGIVFDNFSNNKPFNATFLFENPDELANPITHQSHCSSTSISIQNPTKKLVMLVFLDKKIDMRSTVNVGCYQGNQKVEDGKLRASDMWTERLPEFPELKIVNPLSTNITSTSALNIVELTDYQFDFAQLNRQKFVCYMMEIDYPIWSSTYRIYFEHC